MSMFCDEPILAVYEGLREYDDIEGADAWLDCFHDLTYHVTEGYRIVLETEHHYISLDVHGVTLCDKTKSIQDFEQPGEWLNPYIHLDEPEENDPPWIEYEFTLFVGERLRKVEKRADDFLLCFDDFSLKIVPHALDDDSFPSLNKKDRGSYNRVLGAERHLTRKCACGGEGELLLDFVSDFVVRCKNCKKSTWANMIALDAIEEWNSGRLECDLSEIVIE